MKNLLSTAAVVVVLAVSCVACDKIKPPQPQLQPPPTTSGPVSQPEGERKEFSDAAQKELDDLKNSITEFRARAETASAETKARLGEEVGKLEADLRDTQQRLTDLTSTTVESWHQLKESFGQSLEKLKNGVDKFRKNSA